MVLLSSGGGVIKLTVRPSMAFIAAISTMSFFEVQHPIHSFHREDGPGVVIEPEDAPGAYSVFAG